MNLIVISELFPPEETSTAYIMGEITKTLSDKYNVTIVCGPEVYDQNKLTVLPKSSLIAGVTTIRVKGIKENKANKLSRIRKFLLMSWRLYKASKKVINKGDKVLLVSNPFPLLILMAFHRKKMDYEISFLAHDLFPEPLLMRFKLPNLIYRQCLNIFNRSYARMDKIISLGRDMTDVLREKTMPYNPNLEIIQIENWGDINSIYPMDTHSDSDKITIEYAGNMGKSQKLDALIEIFSKANNKDLYLDFWGTGEQESYLKEKAQSVSNISFHGPYARASQNKVLNACDIAVISLNKSILGMGVPSKSYNILASGKPILYIGPLESEIALMITENRIGYCFDTDNTEGILTFFNNLNSGMICELRDMGIRARKLVETKYSKEIILQKFYNCI